MRDTEENMDKEIIFSELNEEALQKLKEIEAVAYAGTDYAQFQEATSWIEVADDMDCELEKLRLFLTPSFYMLLIAEETQVEIVDFAKCEKAPNLFSVLSIVETFCCKIVMDCRESTSYPIVKAMERFHKCRVLERGVEDWDGEKFYELEIYTEKALSQNPELKRQYERELASLTHVIEPVEPDLGEI